MRDNIHNQADAVSAEELEREMARDPQFEAFLREAADIPVPAGLADRILARHEIRLREEAKADKVVPLSRARRQQQRPASKPIWQQWYAMAASLLLVVGLVGGGYIWRATTETAMPTPMSVAIKASQPMYDTMVVSNQIDPNIEANLHNMLNAIGATKVAELGQINYCETKKVDGKTTGVIVFPGKMGAVTVLFVMDEMIDKRANVRDDHMEGVIWPANKGSIVVIGHEGEPMLKDVEERVRQSIQWF